MTRESIKSRSSSSWTLFVAVTLALVSLLLLLAPESAEALSKRDPLKPTPTPPPARLARVQLNPEPSDYETKGRIVTKEHQLKEILEAVPRVLVHLHAAWSFPAVESLKDSIDLAQELCPSCNPEDPLPTLKDDEVLLVRLDCQSDRAACDIFLNHTTFSPYDPYPGFILFWNDPAQNNQKQIDRYPQLNTRPLHVDSLKKWVRSRLASPFVQRLSSAEEYKKFIAPTDDVLESQTVVAFIGNDASQLQSFRDAASNVRLEGWRFAYIEDENLIKEIGQERGRIGLFFNGTVSNNFISIADNHAPTTSDLKSFICQYGYPSVVPFSIRAHRRFIACAPIPYMIFLLSKDPWVHDQLAEIEMLETITPKYQGKIQFSYQHTPHVWQDFATFVGASGFIFPGAMIFEQKSPIVWEDKKILWDESVEVYDETFTQWLDDFLAGKAVSWRRSLPLPKKNDGPVKTVVGFNFEDVVFDETKDVLLAYSLSPKKCLVSHKMNTILNELGGAFGKTSVVIAQTNGEHNVFPEGTPLVEEFPTLYLYPANNKKSPIEFQETPTARAIGNFIVKHASTNVKINVDALSDIRIEDMKEEIGMSHGSDVHAKHYTQEDIDNINRDPKKEARIPKDHPMYHYSQHVHHHDHDEDGGHHHHRHHDDHDHSHQGEHDHHSHEEEEEFLVLGESKEQATVFTVAPAQSSEHDHPHTDEHFKRHSHYHSEIKGEHPDHERTEKDEHEHEHGHHHQHPHQHKEKHEHEHKHEDTLHSHSHKHKLQHAHSHDHQHKHEHEPIDSQHEHEHRDDHTHDDHQHSDVTASHDHDHDDDDD